MNEFNGIVCEIFGEEHPDLIKGLIEEIKKSFEYLYDIGNPIIVNFKDVSNISYKKMPKHLIKDMLKRYRNRSEIDE